MTNARIQEELAYLKMYVLEGYRNDGPKFRFFRRIGKILRALEATGAELVVVSYENEDCPDTEIRFRISSREEAHRVGQISGQTVVHETGYLYAIYLSDQPGRFCGLEDLDPR